MNSHASARAASASPKQSTPAGPVGYGGDWVSLGQDKRVGASQPHAMLCPPQGKTVVSPLILPSFEATIRGPAWPAYMRAIVMAPSGDSPRGKAPTATVV